MCFQVPVAGKKTRMVKIHSSCGKECEWLGAWSSKPKEWDLLSEDEKKKYEITLTDNDSGEITKKTYGNLSVPMWVG